MHIAFIGGGNMAEAILSGLFADAPFDDFKVSISEPQPQRRAVLAAKFPLLVLSGSGADAVKSAHVVVLAFKPQNLTQVAEELADQLQNRTVVSILAGVTTDKLVSALRVREIIRVMPNLPATVRQGASVWFQRGNIQTQHLNFVEQMLARTGLVFKVEDEELLDVATALSGSGPGYVFTFMAILYRRALKLGLRPDLARQLTIQTFRGSAELADQSGLPFDDLVKSVASPGGTTEAALSQFEHGGLQQLITKAFNAAFERGRQMS